MTALFLDTSGWLAAASPREAAHRAALAGYEAASSQGHRLVTTILVVAEMHAMILRRRGADAARRYLDIACDPAAHEVVYVDEELVTAARARWIDRFADQPFSLCDAVSFEVMRRERITRALSTDQHFAIAGFETL